MVNNSGKLLESTGHNFMDHCSNRLKTIYNQIWESISKRALLFLSSINKNRNIVFKSICLQTAGVRLLFLINSWCFIASFGFIVLFWGLFKLLAWSLKTSTEIRLKIGIKTTSGMTPCTLWKTTTASTVNISFSWLVNY